MRNLFICLNSVPYPRSDSLQTAATKKREGKAESQDKHQQLSPAARTQGVALGDPPLTCAGFISAAAPATATGHSGRNGAP